MKRKPSLMLLAGAAALLAGGLFLFLPGHADATFHRWIGALWLVTGVLWTLAWLKRRPVEKLE